MDRRGERKSLSFEELAARLPAAGLYQVMFRLDAPHVRRVGALGEHRFPSGHWIYTGSARRALPARVRRHASRQKRLRWHIDYLLPPGKVVAVRAVADAAAGECELHSALAGSFEEGPLGFGSSDCRCRSHLVYLGGKRLRLPGFFTILLESGL